MPSFQECFCYHHLFIFYNLQNDFTNIISLKSDISSRKKQTLKVFILWVGKLRYSEIIISRSYRLIVIIITNIFWKPSIRLNTRKCWYSTTLKLQNSNSILSNINAKCICHLNPISILSSKNKPLFYQQGEWRFRGKDICPRSNSGARVQSPNY